MIVAALLQSSSLPPGTYQRSGQLTAPNGTVVYYSSFTVNQDGSITYNLTGGGRFTLPKLSPINTGN
jgi:hypothetical protein